MGNNAQVAQDLGRSQLQSTVTGDPPAVSSAQSVDILRGRAEVLAKWGMLVELSHRTGQTGAMDSLDYFLSTPAVLRKTPYLMLVGLRPGVKAEDATADDVVGASLLYEYRIARLGVKVFATDDKSGRRTVIAPPEIRTRVAELVCRTLVAKGAVTILITLEGDEEARREGPEIPGQPECWIATRARATPGYLPLGRTLDQTLAAMGRHTRRNLRYYRRRLETDLGANFVPRVEISLETFLELNRSSTMPIPDKAAAARYKSQGQMAKGLFAGVRSGDGRWLSLIGGRRHEGTTEIEWQINRAGLPRYSLSTVMRSYLLEHEIAAGATKLIFEHGTSHPMRHAFVTSTAVDILVRRHSLRERVLRQFAHRIFPERNLLRDALLDTDVTWTRW